MSLISKEAAIRKLQDKGEEPMYLHTDEDWKCGLIMAEDIINDLPSAERVGKWERKWHTFFKRELPCCSACGKFEVFERNYCPECGADMRGDGDEKRDD